MLKNTYNFKGCDIHEKKIAKLSLFGITFDNLYSVNNDIISLYIGDV